MLLVIARHSNVPGTEGAGDIGVTLFFVLSGFLISRLLVAEHARFGRIDVRAFYLRRARRLIPALAFFLLVMAAVGVPFVTLAISAGYVANFFAAANYPLGAFRHMWSLAMEEQFYLLWPLLLILCWRWKRSPVVVLSILAGIAEVWRVVLLWMGATGERLAFGGDTRVTALLVGCLIAYKVRRVDPGMAGIAVGTLCALAAVGGVGPTPLEVVGVGASAVLVSWAATTTTSLSTFGSVGIISYGMYLWQSPICAALEYVGWPWWRVAPATFVVSAGVATLSWFLIERPFTACHSTVVAPWGRWLVRLHVSGTEKPAPPDGTDRMCQDAASPARRASLEEPHSERVTDAL